MSIRLALALCGSVILASVPAVAGDSTPASYDALLSQLKSGFTDIDYSQLREAYAATASYDPYDRGGSSGKSLAEALQSTDCPQVLAAANKLLDSNFTNIRAHIYAESCARKLNDNSTAQYHRRVAAGLLGSIAHSGDGTQPESAYVVISTDEEYAFVFASGYEVKGQSLVQFGTHECDALEVADANGARKTIYFNVDKPWAWLAQKFPPHVDSKSVPGRGAAQ